MTARKPASDQRPRGPAPSPMAQRPTQRCTSCGAVFRRVVDREAPCSHCGAATSSRTADYERHAIVIAGATSTWTDDDVAALLRAQRVKAQHGE